MNKILYILCGLCVLHISNVFADDNQFLITCPKIMPCVASDGPKKNQNYANINQQAYECFQKHGETELAKKAIYEQTHCLTVYGATNATIDGQAVN